MTISTTASSTTLGGNGATTVFNFSFIYDSSSYISVTYTPVGGQPTLLTPSQYTLTLNPPAPGEIWGVGGTVTYPTSGTPIPAGSLLTIQRILPLTQTTSISNQGNFYPQVVEEALDTLCMEIQQISARTTQFRGIWITATAYTVGDIVQDGANGSGTGNYYICAIANTSGVWATDLAAGDWILSVAAIVPSGNVILSGDVSGSGPLGSPITTTISANAVTTAKIIDNAVNNAKLAQMAANTIKSNATAAPANAADFAVNASSVVGRGSSGNLANITATAPIVIGTSSITLDMTPITASLGADVTLNNTGTFFDGPTIAQGTSGKWFVSGTVTCLDTVGNAVFIAKLWDGTNVISSASSQSLAASAPVSISLSGYISAPVGNLRISVEDASRTTGLIKFNTSGLSKDSTITAIRIG